jgi:4-diphosphocytidyl-2-C-methyl-D-erythritol kinase
VRPAPRPTSAEGLAHAKVNLALAITGRRPDGYHELRSVFLRIGLADRLEVAVDEATEGDRLEVAGDPRCTVEGNLVLRAWALLRTALGGDAPPLVGSLEKRIPVAGGLGGGSSDAATALRLAAPLWGVTADALRPVIDPATLDALALRLGADVPFFVRNHAAALVEGVGERLAPLPPASGDAGLLLVTPAIGASTPAVFDAYDRLAARDRGTGALVDELAAAFRDGLDGTGLAAWAGRLAAANDLWPAAAAVVPALPAARDAMATALDRPVMLSGSGSTLFALYPSRAEAVRAREELEARLPRELAGARLFAVGTSVPDGSWR